MPEYQATERVDNEQRTEILRQHISARDENLLDIGCADGVLTRRLSKAGLFSIGIEQNELRLEKAQKKERFKNNVRFIRYEITPENIHNLPSFDIVLLLTVYHHWGRNYGWDVAEGMLKQLAEKADKLFFEPPGTELEAIDFDYQREDSIEEYYYKYIDDVFDGRVEIKHIGTADYMGGNRRDPMFLIECENYRST